MRPNTQFNLFAETKFAQSEFTTVGDCPFINSMPRTPFNDYNENDVFQLKKLSQENDEMVNETNERQYQAAFEFVRQEGIKSLISSSQSDFETEDDGFVLRKGQRHSIQHKIFALRTHKLTNPELTRIF
mmetsp:Transcript_65729/g.76434  ORF Transcript_65729/g.76434 Transcript_65729/m.76434 type:complete len:129 (-) Transcript_65729:171-557(-)